MLQLCTALFLASTPCVASIVSRFADLPTDVYDFIVVGGGTAGNVIANRLTENPRVSVLVLEAGVSNDDVLDSIVPFLCTKLNPNTPYDWNYTTAPQVNLGGRSMPYPRGHLLGGSSSVNYMLYTRGSSDDFDRYAKITGDDGWSWDSLQPYILKNEIFTAPADHHDITEQCDPAIHGKSGVNSVTLPGFPQAIDERVINTTSQLSDDFPFNLDMNSGSPLGFGWQQLTTKDGARSSSATSYLAPQFASRPNLHVLLQAQVTRLLQTGNGQGNLSFKGVEFSQSVSGLKHKVTAREEVILSAGAIGTPNILLHSGIGDSKALTSLGIKPLVHLPSVGKNLTDHPSTGISWFVNGNDTFETVRDNATLASEIQKRWNETHTGPFTNPPLSQLGWLRIPNNASIFNTFPDPAAGPKSPHYEILFFNGFSSIIQSPPPGNFMSISSIVVSPLSRGSVTLNSSNPLLPPVIDPNLYDSPFDLFVMREAIRSAQRFVTAPAWADYIVSAFNGNVTTDSELDQFIRDNSLAFFHPVGTAKMSSKDAEYGVVDPDLKVKGVKGLRIVDASVFPEIPAAHTQGPTYIFAERAADLIKAAHQLHL